MNKGYALTFVGHDFGSWRQK